MQAFLLLLFIVTLFPTASYSGDDIKQTECLSATRFSYDLSVHVFSDDLSADLVTVCEQAQASDPYNLEYELALGRLKLNFGSQLEAQQHFERAYASSDSNEIKSVALIGLMTIASDSENVPTLSELILQAQALDYPDLPFYFALYVEEFPEIAELLYLSKEQLLWSAHEQGSHSASVALMWDYYNESKSAGQLSRVVKPLLAIDDPWAHNLMGATYARSGQSLADFEKAHFYFDEAIRFSGNDKDVFISSIKEKIRLDFDLTPERQTQFNLSHVYLETRIIELRNFIKGVTNTELGLHAVLQGLAETDYRKRDKVVISENLINLFRDKLDHFLSEGSVATEAQISESYLALSQFYDSEWGYGFVPVDKSLSQKYLTKSANLKNPTAIANLSWVLRQAGFEETESQAGKQLLLDFTENTELTLQNFSAIANMWNTLGVMYQEEGNTEELAKLAVNAYQKSIEAMEFGGEPGLYFWPYANLGRLHYLPEKGISQDFNKAREFLSLAIEFGEKSYWNVLVENYPDNVPKNLEEAERRFLRLAEDGIFEALLEITWLYDGSTNESQLEKALKYALICSSLCQTRDDQDRARDDAAKLELRLSSKAIGDARDEARQWQMETMLALAAVERSNQPNDRVDRNRDYGRFFGLLIANSDYKFLPKLKTPRNDIATVDRVLRDQFGFENTVIIDGNRRQITNAFNRLKTDLKESDNLLIYYAGHGIQESEEGFWLPVDAELKDDYTWIANSYITRKLREIQANNILVVADSCFSGTLTRSANSISEANEKPLGLDQYDFFYKKKSRMALTSGGVEPVWDGGGADGHSVFAASFINVLEEQQGPISATEIFQNLRDPVLKNSLALGSPQTPTLHAIPLSDHLDPDFVFVGTAATDNSVLE